MVSLWGQNNGSHDGEETSISRGRSQRPGDDDHDDAHERTRLLPPSERNERHHLLNPEDPAVTPYNLWRVRLLRSITILLLIITLIWWILLLVSTFVSVPGLYSRGSGFTAFSFTTLTVGNLAVAVIFFATPSSAMRVCSGILAALIAVDIVIIASVSTVRREEGLVGLSSVIWASLMALWSIIVDRVVATGKAQEEERLTGRPESRRTLKEWLGVLNSTVILIIYIVIAALLTGTLILRIRDASLQYDGHRYAIENGKYKVHLACVGEPRGPSATRKPTILLEAAEGPVEYDFEHWAYSAYQNGTISRYCYWDRPGYGWSENAPSPFSAGMAADALSEALVQANEQSPWILVSGGYGSIVSRIFAARHLKEIEGILMVDPLHEDLLGRVSRPGRGFALWGWGILSPLGIRQLTGAIFKGRTTEDRVYGRSAFQNGKLLKAKLQENVVANRLTKNEISSATAIQGTDMPTVIVSSGIKTRNDREWNRKQEELAKSYDNLVSWDVVKDAPHYVWQTLEGRAMLEKRLRQLLKKARRGV